MLKGGTTHQLSVDLEPNNIPGTTYEWTSSNKNVATIDSSGKITTKSEGTTIIYYCAEIGGNYSVTDVFTLRVVDIDSVFIDGIPQFDLTVGENYNLTAQVYPYYSFVQGVTWSLDIDKTVMSNSVASITSNGKLTLKSAGQVMVFARSKIDNTVFDFMIIDVHPKATGITITNLPSNNSLCVGDTHQLGCIITPDNALKNVVWKSSNTSIATVDKNGLITTKKVGSVTITATVNNSNVLDSCTVTVSYCGGNNYRDVTKHNMILQNDGYYNCNICGYTVKSPELQDKDVLSKDDYLCVYAAQVAYTQIELYKNQGLLNANGLEVAYENQSALYKMANAIRRKSEYINKYDFVGEDGKCVGEEISQNHTNKIEKESMTIITYLEATGLMQYGHSLILGYYCPEIQNLADFFSLLTTEITASDFMAYTASYCGLDEISIALETASSYFEAVDTNISFDDECILVQSGMFKARIIFDTTINAQNEEFVILKEIIVY